MGPERKANYEGNEEELSNRIESEVILDRNSLIISQNFCVDATVGAEEKLIIEKVVITEEDGEPIELNESSYFEEVVKEEIKIRQDYTLIYAAPATPMRSPLLMTVIAKNLSDNDVLVCMEDDADILVEEIVPAKSELALTAQSALFLRALALSPSRVQFFISVFHPTTLF